MYLIVPVCGQSSRYPGLDPKWLLTHPGGQLMLYESLRLLDLGAVDEVVVVCREDHRERYGLDAMLAAQFDAAGLAVPHRLIALPPTASQPETVARAIELGRLEGPVMVKDADCQFRLRVQPGNRVATGRLSALGAGSGAAGKSYVELDAGGRVRTIVEKQVISDTFCAGGYGFEDARAFVGAFRELERPDLYVSHVIYALMLAGEVFGADPVDDYRDWGTLAAWNRFKRRFATLLIELDGVLLGEGGPWIGPRWGDNAARPGVAELIAELRRLGTVQVVVTTSRPRSLEAMTRAQLERCGIEFDQILFGLGDCQRLLVDAYGPARPQLPEAIALPGGAGLRLSLARLLDDLAQ